jgi:hypothetical protein
MDNYKVEDFEVVQEIEPVDGCDMCCFYQEAGYNKRCTVVTTTVGQDLEARFGECQDGHHYKLINKEQDGQN